MKTINDIRTETLLAISLALVGGGALLSLATGLSFLFALFLAIGIITLAFGAAVVVAALVAPRRTPIALKRAARSRPITRPVRVAA